MLIHEGQETPPVDYGETVKAKQTSSGHVTAFPVAVGRSRLQRPRC